MNIGTIPSTIGARHRRKRVGRGIGSGHGKTATRGQKGQRARTGEGKRPGFEGGRSPLIRLLPKRGFKRKEKQRTAQNTIINVEQLNRFKDGERIGPEQFREAGLLDAGDGSIKLLGDGALKKKLVILVHQASRSAQNKVVQAGGSVELISG
ncbi:MAG: 50S ribosomal protein L15 [Candidatus Omnitrophica bacterium]|nr:50S ribosomal protein L15 [Candidatus Omnitrophota bacterium]MBI2174691.1 50S ribosomal protein L15 [Candidatus Omnitrophota bacterium]MBI3010695.1 50S ribosomal protein L15 [Candidatus Omnitrophota bacterium]